MAQDHAGEVVRLPLTLIDVGYNPRQYFDADKHREMVASLKLRGLLQPILVRPSPTNEGRYEIVAGGRRYRACIEAFGTDAEIPVMIRTMTDDEALDAAIDENDVRDDTSETEQADAAVKALAACKGDRAETARRLGWSIAKLNRRLALAGLSAPVKTALNERRIKIGHAELLAAIALDKQEAALTTIINASLDVNKTQTLLMKITQSLATAPFDKSECTACPYNSSMQRALFETHVDDGHCTNPECFKLKSEVHQRKLDEEAAAAAQAEAARVAADEEAARAAAPENEDEAVDKSENASDDDSEDENAEEGTSSSAPAAHAKPAATKSASSSPSISHKPFATASGIAGRTKETREKVWRAHVAKFLSKTDEAAREVIITAAMTGGLSQITKQTLPPRAKILIAPDFDMSDFSGSLASVRALTETKSTAMSAVAAAWAIDTHYFANVAAIARAYGLRLNGEWVVTEAFLAKYTKDELKFIAHEVGLVEHMGTKAFGKLMNGKKSELAPAMMNATGFNWVGLVPSCMSLDGKFEPAPSAPPAAPAPEADASPDDQATAPVVDLSEAA